LDIGRELQNLRARLARVEASARLSHASLDNTNIVVTDGTGTVRGRIGMQADGTIGLIAVDGPAPGAPSAPVVTSTIGGLRVAWDGTLADGTPLPADFDHVAVHAATISGFTPSEATFVGTITRAGEGGMLPLIPLPYQTHYIQLTAVNTSGNASSPSAEVAATPVKVDGPDLEAGSVTAATIQAGAVTAEKLEAVLQLVTRLVAGDPAAARVELNEDGLRVYNASGVLMIQFNAADGSAVFTGAITGSTVTGGTITGSEIQTAASGQRITLNEDDANKILVYNASGTAIGELSAQGLILKGTTGAAMWLDPSAALPQLRFDNATGTNSAYMQMAEVNPGDANLQSVTGQFTADGFTDRAWRSYMGNDFAVTERIRRGSSTAHRGGRINLRADYAEIGYMNSAVAADAGYLLCQPGVAETKGRHRVVPAAASADSVLFVQCAPGHTGYLVRVWDPDASAYRFAVDKSGNTMVNGMLTAGNIAAGRITITPTAPNSPTSGNVTGLNLPGTGYRVVATAVTSGPGTVVTGVGVTNETSTGFTVWVTRVNTNATSVNWIVIAT
jgi:hypothetical protein